MADTKVGTKTGKSTQAGRDVYKTEDGENVSEKSTTFKYKGQWINVPSIHEGYQYDDDTLRMMLDAEVISPTSTHKSESDAVKAAVERSKSLKFNEGGLALGDQMQEALSRRPGFRGDGASDFGGFSDYLKENVSKEELNDGLNFAGEWMLPFYDAGSKVYNVVEEYSKPEDERDYDFIKDELNKAGTSAGTEAAMWLMGGVATKYGAKGVKALSNKAKQYEIDPNSMSAFGVGAIKKKADKVELPPAENAARTQIAGTLPTYKKADTLLKELAGEGKTLDFGAGLGLSKKELGFDTYEPFPKGDFTPDFTSPEKIPSNSYKKITNLNVLNVVPREVRDGIVRDIGRILEPNGTAVITTRGRDVMAAKGKAGPEPMSIITSKDTYQKGFTQLELREYISETLGDGFSTINNKLGAAGVTVQKLATKNFSEGGMAMDDQMQVMFKSNRTGYALGGEVEAIDPVSGNEVPPGSTPKEVRDDIPAMLSEGEYVVPADVTRYYGVKFFEDLRVNAKVSLEDMEDNGRIGGEPVPDGDEDLTEDEMALLDEVMGMNEPIGMAEGGMVGQQMAPADPYQQQAMMYQEPIKAAKGTLVSGQALDAFGNPLQAESLVQPASVIQDVSPSTTSNSPIYGVSTSPNDAATTLIPRVPSTPPLTDVGDVPSTGMQTVFYIHRDGRRLSILMSNGRPISNVPADFNDFVVDTLENRQNINFSEAIEGTEDTGVATEGATISSDSDNNDDDEYEVFDTNVRTKVDPETPEGIRDMYEDSGVNLKDPLKGAKEALGGFSGLDRAEASLLSAIPGIGLPLALGAGLFGVGKGLNSVSKARANQQMAEFLGDTDAANAIQVEIDTFLKNSPNVVAGLGKRDWVAKGDQRFKNSLDASLSQYATEGTVFNVEGLSTTGKKNLQDYLGYEYTEVPLTGGGAVAADPKSTAATASSYTAPKSGDGFNQGFFTPGEDTLRPKLRPSSITGAKTSVNTDPLVSEDKTAPKGLYESLTKTKFKNTKLGKALGVGTKTQTVGKPKTVAVSNPKTITDLRSSTGQVSVNKTNKPISGSVSDDGNWQQVVNPGTNAITRKWVGGSKTTTTAPAKKAPVVDSPPVSNNNNNNNNNNTGSTNTTTTKTSWSDSGWNPKNWF